MTGRLERDLAEALRLCLAGEEAAGLGLYETCLSIQTVSLAPLGLQAHVLEEAGRAQAAAGLRRLALRLGGDLTWKRSLHRGGPQGAALEYEALFAQGLANATMINRYLRVLAALGRTQAAKAIFDLDRLVEVAPLASPPSRAVADAMLEMEANFHWVDAKLSVRDQGELMKLDRLGHPVFDALLAECRVRAGAYLNRWAASDHPLAPLVPATGSITAWGLISRGEGYNTPHFHAVGWATGVYYPLGLPPTATGGSLFVQDWRQARTPAVSIRPEPGLLVLMPSFYLHWTEPVGVPCLRLAIAFDVGAKAAIQAA